MRQKIMYDTSATAFKSELDSCLRAGWLVLQIAVNSETNTWFAVLYKETTQ